MNRCICTLAVVLLAALAGCGPDGPMPVHGTIMLDGKPLERGRIEFEPADGKGPLAAAEITDGKYDAAAFPGKKVVRITGGRVVGRHPFSEAANSPMVEDIQPLLGPAYNSNSTLGCDVSRGQQTYDFELKTTP
jgi:hypothetical protein